MAGREGKCVIFSAPSGAGKTTIVRHLLQVIPELEFSISATSRPPRNGEVDGRDYHFLDPEEFKRQIEANAFLEWEEVYEGRYYGTLLREIEAIWQRGKTVIFDVDVVGGLNIKSYYGDRALAVFVSPPSLEILRERLEKRSTESPESLAIRVSKAGKEMEYMNRFDKILVNDDLEVAKQTAQEWVEAFLKS